MKTSDFDYFLPKELIAQEPVKIRDCSRLMVLDRKAQTIEHRYFYNIIDYLNPGDLLVLNDTKVIPANLIGRKAEGFAKIEVLLVRPTTNDQRPKAWECLVKPGKRLKVGSRVIFGDGELVAKVLEKKETGEQIIEFECSRDFWSVIHKLGEVPLPPYIRPTTHACPARDPRPTTLEQRYQTVYAKKEGASAAPTAGLHFTKELLEKIKAKGVKVAYVTLHTGLATFRPVWTEYVEEHKMYSEYFEIPKETIEAVKKAKRVIAVGTTTVRALESLQVQCPKSKVVAGETNLFIYPGYKFKVVDTMITNFHWPRSTLIMLVSAFAGREFILRAYQEAIQQRYRFYSFGDAMLIL